MMKICGSSVNQTLNLVVVGAICVQCLFYPTFHLFLSYCQIHVGRDLIPASSVLRV